LKRGLDIVRLTFVAVLVLAIALTAGCAEGNKTKVTETNVGEGASRDSRPVVLVPRAHGGRDRPQHGHRRRLRQIREGRTCHETR
jgi:hypothetical protein